MTYEAAITERKAVSVPEAARMLGISRATAYARAADGSLPVIRLGPGRLLVPLRALERLLDGENPARRAEGA